MDLSRYTLKNISSKKVIVPGEEIFELPEKVLQFGTGRLLRGLPDYFIDKANRKGIFNGRVVVVKSTPKGDSAEFDKQDGLYTLCERGIIDGKKIEENIICSSISRVLNAHDEWNEILKCAHNPALQIIISNTTEVGIVLENDDIRQDPPHSFPGKLLAFMYERFKAFQGSDDSGFVIVPTELILNNGEKLKSIVLELAHLNSLEDDFIEWLEKSNSFCNSLVDRIVTGMPDKEIQIAIENELGFSDELLIMSEVYSLWAIEGNEKIKNTLSFAEVDKGVVIEPNIEQHRELKLRLLNGTHTLTCGVSFFSNCATVKRAMEDESLFFYISHLMKNEISPSIPYKIDEEKKQEFIVQVLDRFRNPHINHYWKNITLNYSSKLRLRCVPLLINFYNNNKAVPELMALGFAAYLYFMKAIKQDDNAFYGEFNGVPYLIEDEKAEMFFHLWKQKSIETLVIEVLKNDTLWGYDLTMLQGFQEKVTHNLNDIISNGMRNKLKILEKTLMQKA